MAEKNVEKFKVKQLDVNNLVDIETQSGLENENKHTLL